MPRDELNVLAILSELETAAATLPLSEDARQWIQQTAARLTCLALGISAPGETRQSTPSEAAAMIPAALGLTSEVIAQLRNQQNVRSIGWLFQVRKMTEPHKVDMIAGDIAEQFGVSKTTVYRLGQLAEPAIEALLRKHSG
jgi:hypothetical protein